jgi:hypothetical protein
MDPYSAQSAADLSDVPVSAREQKNHPNVFLKETSTRPKLLANGCCSEGGHLWADKAQPFLLERCFSKWFSKLKTKDPYAEQQRIWHAFHPIVDRLVREERYSIQRTEKGGNIYCLLAEFDYGEQTFQRGLIVYRICMTGAGIEKCTHRQFLDKEGDEVFFGTSEKLFLGLEQTERVFEEKNWEEMEAHRTELTLSETDDSNSSEAELPRIETDPILSLIKIYDDRNDVVISIFPLQERERKYLS